MIPYMVGRLAPNSSDLTRGLVKYAPGKGCFRAISSPNGDKYVSSPPPQKIVELVETTTLETEIEVGEVTMVSVIANGFHERTSGSDRSPSGCVPANIRDGSLSLRWPCRERLLDGVQCEIIYGFDEPQAISVMRIAFY